MLQATQRDTSAAVPIETRTAGFDRAEMLERNLARQIEAIRASDAKVTLLVPTSTAMVGILAAQLRLSNLGLATVLYVIASTLPLVAAYALTAMAVIPRLHGGGSRSLLFFGGLAGRRSEEAGDGLLAMTPEAYLADLARECHASAAIARTKYRLVRHAYLAFFIAMPFWALAIYLLNRQVI